MLNCDTSTLSMRSSRNQLVSDGYWAPNVVFLANDDVLINLLFFLPSQLNSGKACLQTIKGADINGYLLKWTVISKYPYHKTT